MQRVVVLPNMDDIHMPLLIAEQGLSPPSGSGADADLCSGAGTGNGQPTTASVATNTDSSSLLTSTDTPQPATTGKTAELETLSSHSTSFSTADTL